MYSTEHGEAVEEEVAELLAALVRATKPRTVVEIGTCWGRGAAAIAEALRRNGLGRLHTYEIDAERAAAACDRLAGYAGIVDVVHGDAADHARDYDHDSIDLLFVDGHGKQREADMLLWGQRVRAEGLICVHDALKDEETFLALRRTSELWPAVWIRTPRGLTILQKQAGP